LKQRTTGVVSLAALARSDALCGEVALTCRTTSFQDLAAGNLVGAAILGAAVGEEVW
jgi:hypothetical protein